eukprot:Phypoly_transcript_12774.p1 GENE.Phypoly_transcript_12774~~Phypoly_transcript_12774.p1  ORF type:complete len:363 (+),score=56.67 Phypoly_transcript_12774:12-1100(+)
MAETPVPCKIFPAFYISGYDVASDLDVLYEYDITHILTVAADTKPKWPKKFKYLTISAYDMETENLKQHFAKCNKFIEEGRSDGTVLVHCMAGVSRSATICIAYILQKLKVSLEDAVGLVKDARPDICPNDGFMRQLKAYEQEIHGTTPKPSNESPSSTPTSTTPPSVSSDFPTPLSTTSPTTHKKSAQPSTEHKKSTQPPTEHKKSTQPSTEHEKSTHPPTENEKLTHSPTENKKSTHALSQQDSTTTIPSNAHTRYCCRMCGTTLFTDIEVLAHDAGTGQISFDWRKRNRSNSQVECTSYFLYEPTQFGDTTELEGKLSCPKCNSKFGSWMWAGAQCSCGAWITPAFQVSKARVDTKAIK